MWLRRETRTVIGTKPNGLWSIHRANLRRDEATDHNLMVKLKRLVSNNEHLPDIATCLLAADREVYVHRNNIERRSLYTFHLDQKGQQIDVNAQNG